MGDTGGDHDLYDYCVDDPVSFVDPQGLAAEKVEEQSNALQRLLCEYYSILACPPGSPKRRGADRAVFLSTGGTAQRPDPPAAGILGGHHST